MDGTTYRRLALRTEKPLPSVNDRKNHAVLWICNELGELALLQPLADMKQGPPPEGRWSCTAVALYPEDKVKHAWYNEDEMQLVERGPAWALREVRQPQMFPNTPSA